MNIRDVDGAFHAIYPGKRLRVALLRSDDPHHRFLEAKLAHRLHLVGVVVEPGRAQQSRLRRRGLVASASRGYQGWRQRITGRAAYRSRYFASLATGKPLTVARTIEVDWVNAESARAFLTDLSPDVIVVCGTTYVQPQILATAALAINVHGGYLPHYKGNHGVFFAFERGDFERIGASLHLVSAELDGGDLIEVVRCEVFPHDHDEHLYCRSVHAAVLRLCVLLEGLEAGQPLPHAAQPRMGQTFRHRDRTPGRELRLWLRRRLGRHGVPYLPAAVERPRDLDPVASERRAE